MAQFDLYRNANPAARQEIPYLLDIQNDLLAELATRVVIPLYRKPSFSRPAQHLNPEFTIDGDAVVLATQELAGVPCQGLGERVTSLGHLRDEIVAAVDFLISGF